MGDKDLSTERFRLAEPYHYVVELVRAVVAAGAGAVDVDMDADDMILTCDAGLASHEIDAVAGVTEPGGAELLWHTLSAPDPVDRRLGHLARGLINGLLLEPKRLTLESGDGSQGTRLRFVPPDGVVRETVDGSQGLRIHLRERFGLKVIAEALFSTNPEEKVLAEYCRFASIPVRLNGHDLRGAVMEDTAVRRRFELGGVRGELALPIRQAGRGEHPARIVLCTGGVKVDVEESRPGDEWHGTGMLAFVDSTAFGLDPKRNRVLDDDARLEAFDLLTLEYRAAMLEVMARELGPREERTSRKKADRIALLRHAARLFLRADEPGPLPDAIDKLLDVAEMVDIALSWPHHAPLRIFWDAVRDGDVCRMASRSYPVSNVDISHHRPDWKLNLVAAGPFDLLQAVFGNRLAFADDALTDITLGKGYFPESLRGKLEPELGDDQVLLHVAIEAKGIQGQAGPTPVIPQKRGVRATLLKQGRFLAQENIADTPFCGVAVLESETAWFDLDASVASYHRAEALRRARRALGQTAALSILRALQQEMKNPPPPEDLLSLPCWADGRLQPRAESDIGIEWPLDTRSRVVRWHLDDILPRVVHNEADCPFWLRFWPVFQRLDGTPVYLAWLLADPGSYIRFVQAQPWGRDVPDLEILNLSAGQHAFLKGLLGHRMTDFTTSLHLRRGG